MLPQHDTERQWSVNDVWSCILCNQGFAWINELITELLTAVIAKNTTYNRKNTDSTITNIADCKTCKKRLMAVKYVILKIYYYPTAQIRTLYKSTDGPAGRLADNQLNSAGLGDFHWTTPDLTVQVYWQPGPPINQRFRSNLDPDRKWQSGTVTNTCWQHFIGWGWERVALSDSSSKNCTRSQKLSEMPNCGITFKVELFIMGLQSGCGWTVLVLPWYLLSTL